MIDYNQIYEMHLLVVPAGELVTKWKWVKFRADKNWSENNIKIFEKALKEGKIRVCSKT